MNVGERISLKKKRTRRITIGLRGSVSIDRIHPETGDLLGTLGPFYNTMDAGGIDEFLNLIAGVSSKHLDTTNTWWVLGDADPLVAFALKMNPPDAGPLVKTPVKGAPSWAYEWRFEDNTITVRNNLNHGELWYKDPEGMVDEVKINHINGAWGNKPATEFWHWKPALEFYSTDTDFTSAGLQDLLDMIMNIALSHIDDTHVWFRPFTSADTGLGSTGILPDSVSVDTVNNKITIVFTAADGVFNGAWDKSEIKTNNTTYATAAQLRYGGCKQDGTGCGTKSAGESWEYTWELVFAQGA